MASLGYHIRSEWTDDGIEFLDCGGSIISQFYVITVAHCIPKKEHARKKLAVGKMGCRKYYMSLDFVRLGDHNVETDPDCTDASFCADPYQDYTISQTIIHEYYNERYVENDIALIRVRKRIKFTKFIRPICLLRGKLISKNFTESNGLVAGWGVCDIKTREASKVLQVVELPILSQRKCRAVWGYGVSDRQMCAGGTTGKGSCNGDSGGPLMKIERVEIDRHRGFHLLGLVSYGSYDCGARKTPDTLIEKNKNWKYLNFKICGASASVRSDSEDEDEAAGRIVGGTDARLGAYPWMARLGYHIGSSWTDKGLEYLDCGGSVISQFYVVTAAHCIPDSGRARNLAVGGKGCKRYYMSLDFVRLGEHNVETDPDCAASFCADPYKDYTISHTLVHEYYSDRTVVNDIALIRVRRRIVFTKYIRPICLLRGKLLQKDFEDYNAIVAGWGVCDISTGESSTILQTVRLPILSHEKCQSSWGKITEGQMCAGGTIGKDSCNGDSGGPLMKIERVERDRHRGFHLLGLVSYGRADCGAKKIPGVYTRVSAYTLWILEKIRG
ncbi:hypothetical protein QAD02_004376 [Eretmocerus hayati]|uniref:Uncharacterized protein n=1 Tax=Eretmocerus hayati TaxID=131215 RepID=A0ACC2NS39_9HYME|nr:hypothetical protein QAD02_004376 [Eretmocerus hayati]